MEGEELERYQQLPTLQKDIVDALKQLGFRWKYFTTYELIGWGTINVSKVERWSELLREVHEQGKDQKRFEFQRVLGI